MTPEKHRIIIFYEDRPKPLMADLVIFKKHTRLAWNFNFDLWKDEQMFPLISIACKRARPFVPRDRPIKHTWMSGETMTELPPDE